MASKLVAGSTSVALLRAAERLIRQTAPLEILEKLARTEAEIQGVVASIEGSIEEKDSQLRELGVYRRYADVFSRYIAAFESSPRNLEPLKRAAFLSWYEIAEPPCFSGVGELPTDARHSVLALLEEHASNLDNEFRWMLAYYFHTAPYAFAGSDSHAGVRHVLETTDSDAWLANRTAKDRLSGRGLMGEYWLSVFGSGAV